MLFLSTWPTIDKMETNCDTTRTRLIGETVSGGQLLLSLKATFVLLYGTHFSAPG